MQRTYEELAGHYGTAILPARPAHRATRRRSRWRCRSRSGGSSRGCATRSSSRWTSSTRACGAARRPERPPDATLRQEPPRRSSSRSTARRCVRCRRRASIRRLGEGAGEHRLPRGGRRAPLLGAVRLVHEEVEVRVAADAWRSSTAEAVAAHRRSYVQGGFTTETEHMPSAHREHAEWTPSRILSWAARSARRRASCARRSSPTVRIPSRASARAWASCG